MTRLIRGASICLAACLAISVATLARATDDRIATYQSTMETCMTERLAEMKAATDISGLTPSKTAAAMLTDRFHMPCKDSLSKLTKALRNEGHEALITEVDNKLYDWMIAKLMGPAADSN